MTKLIVVALCAGVGIAAADDAPQKPNEKAGSNETLQNGGESRPWAVGVSEAEQKAALALFQDGNVMLNDGLFAKAVEKYREALKHWDHPAIHYNLALAQMNLDQPIDAFENLTVSIKYGEAPLQSKDKFDHAKDYLLLLEKELADVEVTCDKPGAKVSLDGKEVFTAPGAYKTRVRVGKHTFVAEKQGYTTRINAPYVGPGEHFRIELKLYTADELTRYHRRWTTTWFPYAIIGAGVAVGFAGGILELSATNTYRKYDAQVASCNAMNMNAGCADSSSLQNLRSTGDNQRVLGQIGYGVAAAAVVAGGLLAWLNRPQAYLIRAEDLPAQVTVAPIVAPGMAGAAVQGHF